MSDEPTGGGGGSDAAPASAGTGGGTHGLTASDLKSLEKIALVEYSDAERGQILESIGELFDFASKRRSVPLPNELPPATHFQPRVPGWLSQSAAGNSPDAALQPRMLRERARAIVQQSIETPPPLPSNDEDIAFAPLSTLAAWIRSGTLSSARLTEIYLERLRRIGPKLRCAVTLTEQLARDQAARADEELRAGRYRGALHGIPWGAKDLFDTAGIPTTWGAEPYRDRVPDRDATVVARLADAGAVLVAKLSLGALAYGDIWHGGRTNNPWDLSEGSSGSSAGSAAATAAGLVGFALGTETMGSIVSPSQRCGTTGLRPSFGLVPRTGAMALCWSFDKIGPICRSAGDTLLVLDAIAGPDGRDLDCAASAAAVASGAFDAAGASFAALSTADARAPSAAGALRTADAGGSSQERPLANLRIGCDPEWFADERTPEGDRIALERLRALGAEIVPLSLPELPYDSIMALVYAEAASAFEELTLSGRDDELAWQEKEAWPNVFRMSRFLPAVEYVQIQRFRTLLGEVAEELFERAHLIASPAHVEKMLILTNATGHPSLTVRSGFTEAGKPHGLNLWGRLYDEGALVTAGIVLERALGVASRRPAL